MTGFLILVLAALVPLQNEFLSLWGKRVPFGFI